MIDELRALPESERRERVITLERETTEARERAYAEGADMRAAMSERQTIWRIPSHAYFQTFDR
jgi:hypothetical protein